VRQEVEQVALRAVHARGGEQLQLGRKENYQQDRHEIRRHTQTGQCQRRNESVRPLALKHRRRRTGDDAQTQPDDGGADGQDRGVLPGRGDQVRHVAATEW
jgi:hypothetical protein